MVLNLIWEGCKPITDSSLSGYHRQCDSGVYEFNDLKEVSHFIEDESVRYGEDGGTFKIHGGWEGTFKDLKEGKTPFITENEIHNRLIWD